MRPEEALAAAGERAAAARAAGGYAEPGGGFTIEPRERIGTDRLMEWAVLEPDESNMRSTRRFGGPVTWVKQKLVHVLRQYHGELTADQTRFNMHLLIHVAELEDRLARVEAERDALRVAAPAEPGEQAGGPPRGEGGRPPTDQRIS